MSEYQQMLMEAGLIPLDEEAQQYLCLVASIHGFEVWL